jgi:hypothetical protein
MRTLIPVTVLALCFVVAASAAAQTPDELQIVVRGMVIRSTGGEQSSVGSSTGAVVIGKTHTTAIGKMPGMCGLGVAGRLEQLNLGMGSAWTLDATPTRVADGAVTFRLRWQRREDGRPWGPANDGEFTLRPGESVPVDTLPLVPPTNASPFCNITAMTLRVGVEYWPRAEVDRRLVATDLWLIERLPDGTERSEPVSIRGQYNVATPFYFNTITDGTVELDIFGEVRVAPGDGFSEVHLETRSRIVEGGKASLDWRQGNWGTSRKVDSVVQLKPGEVVSVELPRLSQNDSGAFASRSLSIRIRSRQLR